MLAKIGLLTLLVAASSALPVILETSTVNYDEAVAMFLQAWKKMLPCGYEPYHIPVMAPLTRNSLTFNYTKGETSIVGNVSYIRISGLNNFEVLNGTYDETTQHASFDILFPEIQVLGATSMKGVVNILGFSFPLQQDILLNERFEQLRIVGENTFGQSLTKPNGLRISEFHLQFYLGEVKIDNWDTLFNISINDYSNQWSQQLTSLFVKELQPFVDQLMAENVVPHYNDLLADVNMTQLTNFFVNTANAWNQANCNVQA